MRKRYFGRLLSIVLSATLAFTSAVPAHAMSPTEGEIPDETVTDEDAVDPEVTDEEKPEIPEEQVVLEEPEVTQNLPAQEEVPEEVLEVVPEDVQVEPLGEANNDVVVFESYDESDNDLLGASESVTINVTYDFSDGEADLDGVTNPTSNKNSYTVYKVAEPGTITLTEPSKTFYTFQEFAVDSQDVTFEIAENVITIPDLSLYEGSTIALTVTGVFDPKEFAIEIDGEAAPAWTYDPEGYEIAPLAPVVGQTFEGWHVGTVGTTPTGTNRLTPPAEGDVNWVYVPKASDASKEKLSFFSNVTVNTYNVVYKLNSGTNNTRNKTSYKYSDLEDGIITFYAPTKANYTFAGWFLDEELSEAINEQTEEEVTIWPYEIGLETPTTLTVYAKYDPAEYEVAFAEGDYTNPNASIEGYVYGNPIELEAATWEHHDFVGWYTDAKFTNAVPYNKTTDRYTLTKPTGDLTFYPKFAQYNINYVLNGGVNADNPLVFAISDETIELIAPEKLDYEFKGWYTDSSFKNSILDESTGKYVYTIKSTDKKTLTFYANWEEKSGIRIPINYVLNEKDAKNNSGNPVTVIVADSKPITLYPATKTGYDFVGWYVLNEDGEEVEVPDGTDADTWVYTIASALAARDAGKLTFYGKLEPSTIPIKYMSKGIELVPTTDVTYGGVYPASMLTVDDLDPNPGYAFEGWYSDATLKSKIVPGTTALPKTAPDAYYVYAKWTEKTYTANFHSNLAKDTKVTKKFKFTTDKEFVLDPQVIFGKTLIPDSKMTYFEGWALSLPDVQGPYNELTTVNELIAEDISNSVNVTVDFYAQWPETEDYYVVKFNAGNITGDAADFADSDFKFADGLIQYKVVFVDEDYALTGKEFARTGYTLTGWTYEDSKGKKVTLKPTATFKNIAAEGETVELTATWSGPASYTVKFNLNGGKFTGEGTLPSKYTYDNAVTLPVVEDMTKTGYIFAGWILDGTYTSVTKIGKGGDVSFGNVTLIATWNRITYSVIFDENGGTIQSVAPGVTSVPLADIDPAYYDLTYSLKESDLEYSRPGYTFKNWTYLGDDGKVKTIAANGIIKNITATDGRAVEFTANWNPVKYTISYQNISGAKLATSSKSYTPDKLSDVFVGKPTKTGYKFVTWAISYDKKGGNNIALEADVNEQLEDGFTFTAPADAWGNVILTAEWEALPYNLDIYDSEGDNNIKAVQHPYDDVINFSELAAELTYSTYAAEGKSVKGFAISSKNALKGTVKYALGKNYKISDIVSAAKPYDNTIDLYVVTENEKYFIKSGVIIDDGAYSESTVINYDKSKGYTITPAKKPGYTFVNWTLADGSVLPGTEGVEYTINSSSKALTIAKNKDTFKFAEIAANYVSNTYTVVLLPNASDVEDDNTSNVVPTTGVTYDVVSPIKQADTTSITLPEWTRNGYTLDGFALTAKGTKLTNFGNLYTKADKNGIVKVYALWTPTEQNITYGTTANVTNAATLSIDSEVAAIKANLWVQKTGSAVTLPTLKVTGYKFLGWKLTGDNENVTLNKDGYATKVNASNYEDVGLTAEFEENTYKLTLNTNGSFYTGTAGGKTYNNYKGTIVLNDKVRYSEDILPLVEAAAYDFDKAGCYGIGSFHSMAFAAKANYKQANQWLDSYYNGGTIILRSTKDVTIYPQLTTISVAKAADVRAIYEDDDLTVYWANLGNSAGFEIQYATNPLFLFGAQTEQANSAAEDATITSLTAKKYYVRVRQYVPDSTGARVYGAWSSSVSAAKAYANVVDFTVASDDETGNIALGTRKAAVGEKVLKALGTPVEPGYDFVGWYEEATCETKVKSSDVTTVAGDYFAKLTPSKFKVSFSWGTGASGGAKLSPIEVTYKETYPELPVAGNVKKTGYTFGGWSFDGETPVAEGDEVLITSNATLVPIWVPEEYNVSYDLNYPTSDAAPVATTVTFASTYEEAAEALATRDGYILKGWYTAKSGGTKVLPTTKVTTAKDHTLYAQWEIVSYSVKFVANAPEGSVATGKMADEVYKYTDNKALTANAYKVTGYTFDGWATAEDGTVVFANKQIISGYSTLIGNVDEHNTYTLYGVWKPVEYTLTIVVGQKKSNVPVKAHYGDNVLEALGNATLPEIEGMETDGNFYISSTFNTANMVKDTAKVAGAKTYYVRWVEADTAP